MTIEIGMTEAIIGTFVFVLVGILVCDRLLIWWGNRVGQPDGVATWWDSCPPMELKEGEHPLDFEFGKVEPEENDEKPI